LKKERKPREIPIIISIAGLYPKLGYQAAFTFGVWSYFFSSSSHLTILE